MKKLQIVYMGTPEFAVAGLKKSIEAGHQIVAVVTAPDRPAGRGKKIKSSAVKDFALQNNLPVLQPPNLKSPDFVEELKKRSPDVIVVVAFRMLPKVVWEIPKYGTFNLHASLLPQYRGAAPINWAIINGETKTGVSTFFIDENIDTGEIILQKEIEIGFRESAGELHDKLMEAGADLIVETLSQIAENTIQPQKQKENEDLKPAPKLTPENTKIDFQKPLPAIYNQIRGLSPYPVAWAWLQHGEEEVRCKIYRAEMEEGENDFLPGT
ncbi:MAG TPA: methionyl-tRNA formyltransferase, partial [Flavobacteriaceae bacterium]|nr:methionyl-tRNA formyltransferase [Flavobacteriaceae bacterium]